MTAGLAYWDFPLRLVTDTRYYTITVRRDLLNDLVIVCDYGSRIYNLHHRKIIAVSNESQVDPMVQNIYRKRKRHGYYLLNQSEIFC